jgi:hypothetical protein
MPTSKSTPASPAPLGVPKEAATALAAVETEFAALALSELVPINLDMSRAVAVAIGALPRLRDLRARLVAELPHHPIHTTDKLGTYALAAWYAHLLALPASKAERALEALLAEVRPLREDLLVAAEALARKKLLDPKAVAGIRSGLGHLDRANDLVALAALFTENWSRVQGKTTVEPRDIERAAELGPLLLVELGAREQAAVGEPMSTDPAGRRARAFTLFFKTYEEARRAVAYLRWYEQDVDDIVPSLFAYPKGGRKGKQAKAKAAEGEGSPTES